MGSKENNSNILNYAEEIFGEPFDKDAIITEDRLSAHEFFAGSESWGVSSHAVMDRSPVRCLCTAVRQAGPHPV